ncbi:MAG: glycosyltransferase family 4 protein [Burkholderiales bacterium]|nr:glycosyltransferase family 4 protein [Burkholderiales bacterium]
MRIALLGPYTGPSLAGAFAFPESLGPLPPGYPGAPLLTVLAKALVERGHQVATISTDYSTPIAELEPFRSFKGREIQAYFCPQRPRSFRGAYGRRGRMLDFFRYERDCLRAAIADFAPEVIHAHWTYEFVWAALDSGVPTLATAHDSPLKVVRYTPNMYRLWRYFMARRVLARCRHLTAVSPDLERDLQGYVPGPIHVVANPIADTILQAPGCVPQAQGSKTLMMVLNGWTDLKNGATALQAFHLAQQVDPELRLVCFGAGFEAGGAAQSWAAGKGYTANVEFRGPTPHALILEKMRTSMALLHPSRWEACCMSIAESMSVGLPVIAGRATDGVPWQLDGGRAGVLTDVTDAQAMADAIITLAHDRARWQEISAAARARARLLFAIDPVVDRYVELYGEVRASEPMPNSVPARA